MRGILFLFLTILVYASIFGGSVLFWKEKFHPSPVPANSGLTESKKGIILLFVGDIMLDRGVEWQIRQHGNDWKWPFLKIAEVLKEADLVFANLESVISDKGKNLGSAYSFRADPKAIEGLVFAGFDILSVANNHSFDYGLDAFGDSLNRLKNAGISPVGGGFSKTEARNPVLKEVKGTRVGFLAYTNAGSPLWQTTKDTPGIAWADETTVEQLKTDVMVAKAQNDILVVSFHWGVEYQKEPTATQKLLAKTAIDAGADLVIGHHPHVMQLLEQYKQGWIAYSLGNFVFDQGFSPETMEGMLLEVKVVGKQITQAVPRVIRINSFFQPTLE